VHLVSVFKDAVPTVPGHLALRSAEGAQHETPRRIETQARTHLGRKSTGLFKFESDTG
jgi:hypothetical protein